MSKWIQLRHKPKNIKMTDMEYVAKSRKRKIKQHQNERYNKEKAKFLRRQECLLAIREAQKNGEKLKTEALVNLYVSCKNKNRYDTFPEAKAAAIKFKFQYGVDYFVYKCHYAEHFHVSTHARRDKSTLWGTGPITDDKLCKSHIKDDKVVIHVEDEEVKKIQEGPTKQELIQLWSVTNRSIWDIDKQEKMICVSLVSKMFITLTIKEDGTKEFHYYIDEHLKEHLDILPPGYHRINHLGSKTIWRTVKKRERSYIWEYDEDTAKQLKYLRQYDIAKYVK